MQLLIIVICMLYSAMCYFVFRLLFPREKPKYGNWRYATIAEQEMCSSGDNPSSLRHVARIGTDGRIVIPSRRT